MKQYEAEIKVALLEYIMATSNDSFIVASEVPINQAETIVDILQISKDCCFAYEIKSDRDNFLRLHKQLDSYTEVFDYTSVVVPSLHYPTIKELIPQKIGILEFVNGKIVQRRLPTRIKRLNKISLSKLIWKNELVKIIKDISKVKTSYLLTMRDFELRELLVRKLNLIDIKQRAYNFLYEKYKISYDRFRSVVGRRIHIDDLSELELKDSQVF